MNFPDSCSGIGGAMGWSVLRRRGLRRNELVGRQENGALPARCVEGIAVGEGESPARGRFA